MSEADTRNTKWRTGRPWARTGFDLEGLIGALAALLVGMLLGALWGPLFLLGAALAGLALLATRKQARTPPDLANLVIAPCDGVIQSVELALPPSELRLPPGERLRLRIASSPASTNPLHASITGEVTSVILEEPNPAVVFASASDMPGLAVAHICFDSMGDTVGLTISTGGFGPRLEITAEAGDAVRAGRLIGKRRLGGWCDVYLKADARVLVSPGQTLVGSETVLCRLTVSPDETATLETVAVSEPDEDEAVPAEPSEPGSPEEETARLFEKLKRHAEQVSDEDV